MNAVLPKAKYIGDGEWLIATAKPLIFTKLCKTTRFDTTASELKVLPPLQVIHLDEACAASNDHLTLPPHYKFHSENMITENTEFAVHTNLSTFNLWKPLRESVPNLNYSLHFSKLNHIDEIDMTDLIAELKAMKTIENGITVSDWGPYGAIFVIVILIITFLIFKKKGLIMYKKVNTHSAAETIPLREEMTHGEKKILRVTDIQNTDTQHTDVPSANIQNTDTHKQNAPSDISEQTTSAFSEKNHVKTRKHPAADKGLKTS